MFKAARNLFFGVTLFFVIPFFARGAETVGDSGFDANQVEVPSSFDSTSISETTSNLKDSIQAKIYVSLVNEILDQYNDAQTNGGVIGAVDRSSDHLDKLGSKIADSNLCQASPSHCSLTQKISPILKTQFLTSEKAIREALDEIKSYAVANTFDASGDVGHPLSELTDFDSFQNMSSLSVPNSVIIPIWMRSADLHFQKAVSENSALEFQRGISLLETIVFQKSRYNFVYDVPASHDLEEGQQLEMCYNPEHADQPEHVEESLIASLNRKVQKAQAVLDAVSPLTPVFDWIHEGVTGEERTAQYSQDYWDIRQSADGKVHTVLDLAGLVPVIGEPVDAYSGLLYTSQGDAVNASLSFASTIPFAGWGGTGGKFINRFADVASDVKPSWLDNMAHGKKFDLTQSPNYPYNQVYIKKPNGPGYYILDSYNPELGEIVSRKYTQLSDINESTALNYIKEIGKKYSSGSTIADVPSSVASGLNGQTLVDAQYILEVPVQNAPIPQSILDAADEAGVLIRDITGKIY